MKYERGGCTVEGYFLGFKLVGYIHLNIGDARKDEGLSWVCSSNTLF